jgi:type IV secretion system protein VirB1
MPIAIVMTAFVLFLSGCLLATERPMISVSDQPASASVPHVATSKLLTSVTRPHVEASGSLRRFSSDQSSRSSRLLLHGLARSRPISPQLLVRLIRACAPHINPITQAAVVAVESSGDAWALHDDNDGRVYRPRSFPEALATADFLIANNQGRYGVRDAGVDVGVAQINSNNFAALGVDAGWMLHPCANLRVSSRMLAAAYRTQYALLVDVANPHRDRLAMRRALQVYNSGRSYGDEQYVKNVIVALTSALVRRMQRVANGKLLPDGRYIFDRPYLQAAYAQYGSVVSLVPAQRKNQKAHAPRIETALFVHESPFRSHGAARKASGSWLVGPTASLALRSEPTSEISSHNR